MMQCLLWLVLVQTVHLTYEAAEVVIRNRCHLHSRPEEPPTAPINQNQVWSHHKVLDLELDSHSQNKQLEKGDAVCWIECHKMDTYMIIIFSLRMFTCTLI